MPVKGKAYSFKGRPVFVTGYYHYTWGGQSNTYSFRRIRKDGTLSTTTYSGTDEPTSPFTEIKGAEVVTVVRLPWARKS